MSGANNTKEAGPLPNPFMKEWVTALAALDRQSSIFRFRNADFSKHKAMIQIEKNILQLSFDPDTKTVIWESKTPDFTLDCICGDWSYSNEISAKSGESFESLVSPIFMVGNQLIDIAFERFLSTDKRVVKKSIIATAPEK